MTSSLLIADGARIRQNAILTYLRISFSFPFSVVVDHLLPLLLYPLLVPLFIGGVKSVSALMDGQMETVWMWMRVMAGMDLAFLVGGQLLFGWVLSAIE